MSTRIGSASCRQAPANRYTPPAHASKRNEAKVTPRQMAVPSSRGANGAVAARDRLSIFLARLRRMRRAERI